MARKDISDRTVCIAYSVMEFLRAGSLDYITADAILQMLTDEPIKVCYAAMERASDRGYIEYGVSLRTGWLTEKGQELIN